MTMSFATGVSAEAAEFDAVTEPLESGNVLYESDFDSNYSMQGVEAVGNSKNLKQIRTDTGCYLQIDKIIQNYIGVNFHHPNATISAGTYQFTGYFRMMHEGEVTSLRIIFHGENSDGESTTQLTVTVYPTSDEWLKVQFYLTLNSPLSSINVCGQTDPRYVQPYCMDNFSLVPVDPSVVPDDYKISSFGTPVSGAEAEASQVDSKFSWPNWNGEFESRYDVQGVIVNQDADSFIGSVTTEDALRDFAEGYAGSHVTDFMMCVNNMNSTYPSKVFTSLSDKYLQKKEGYNPKTEAPYDVDYSTNATAKAAYNKFVVQGIDYFKILCEEFPKVGINPWISFRMNDLHGQGEKTSLLLSDFFHENPQYRIVQENRRDYAAGTSYYFRALDYGVEAVRDRFLAYIDEALGRYDCYGIELDFQREIWLWSHGKEYNGIEILNDFMRDVADIVSKYEVARKKDIKVCVRVASNIETNYDFGLDVMTWAAEDLIDMIIPTGRWDTTDTDIPVTLWTSMMHPFEVTVAPCIEINIVSGKSDYVGEHTLETYNGIAASFLSQGADKVALYNQYISSAISDKQKVSTTDEDVEGNYRHWNIVSTIGSHDKLMTLSRRLILTSNDTYQVWRQSNAQLQFWPEIGQTGTLRFPIGDVPVGATAVIKFSVNTPNDANPPDVYINSVKAKFLRVETNEEGYTTKPVLVYEIPASALNDMFAVAEITPHAAPLRCDYAEIRIDPAK